MSEQPDEIELPPQADEAFSSLMDLLVASEPGAEGDQAGEQGAAAAGGAGGSTAADQSGAGQAAPVGGAAAAAPADPGAAASTAAGGDAAPTAGAPVAGADGAAVAADGSAGGGADAVGGGSAGLPVGWTVDPADIDAAFSDLSTKLEEKVADGFKDTALAEVRADHGNYFDALEKHPRLLVGTQVPAIGKEGMELIKDTADAREWQEAVKSLLVEEVRDRAGRAMEADSTNLTTVHASIELFQKNRDMIPGTKTFDKELANRFAAMVKPYEARVEGKLRGYSIPVQPIIDQLRAQITAERAAAPAAASPAATGAPAAPAARKPADPPQAGIVSKPGHSGAEAEDYSALFGTLGLPNFRI